MKNGVTYARIKPRELRIAQVMMILFSQALDSSTVRPDLEKFIRSRATAGFFIGFDVVGTRFQNRFEHFVGTGFVCRIFNQADAFEVKGHRAGFAHIPAAL